jgi:hypothetical protein
MNRFLLCIALFIFVASAQAQQISKIEAASIASAFYKQRLMMHHKTSTAFDIKDIVEVQSEEQLVAYAINFKAGGFALVSASKKTLPVLGYSFENNFNPSQVPDALKAWLAYYGRQLSDANGRSGPDSWIAQHRNLLTASFRTDGPWRYVEPMLRTSWDQGINYNGSCPPDVQGPGGRCYAGCVATAVGQLMYYHRWPNQGTGEYSYLHPVYGEQYANFGETNYYWNGMETALTGPNRHISTLLYHLGISFDMDYGPNGSGMWNHSAANSMRNFFKYGPETQYVFRDETSMNWDSIIIANLEVRKPLYYAGWEAVGSQNGHAFVCDGYSPDGFYHFNWGWSGSNDGYFLLSALSPGGNNFNFAQELIRDIYPDTTNYTYPLFCSGLDTLWAITGTFSDGSNRVNYPGGSDCFWLLQPNEPDYDSISGIQLSFPLFDLAENDTLRIYEGDDLNGTLIAAFTAGDSPEIVEIQKESTFIWFSGENGDADGFLAAYKSALPVYCAGITTITDASGALEDGSGSKRYTNNNLCRWKIVPQNLVPLTLTIDSLDLAQGDFLQIFDLGTQQVVATLSGNILPEPINIASGKTYLVFSTDGSGTAKGWALSWAPQTGVGIDPAQNSGIILYPNPAMDFITIEDPAGFKNHTAIEIYDLSGQVLLSKENLSSHSAALDISILSRGMYLLKIFDGNSTQWHRFIRN